MKFAARSFLLAFALLPLIASSAELSGRVVGVADGDTVTVLDADQTQHRVRIGGIDAPERRQPFSDRSKQNLSSLVFAKTVIVRWHKRDRYRRLVGVVQIGQVDAGLEQVRAGMAWHYKEYELEQTPSERLAYARAEQSARADRRGLWRDPEPVPPWEFRRRGR